MTLGVLVTLVLLLVFNALYVAAEFGAVSVRQSRIRQAAEQGQGLARRLLPFLVDSHKLDRYIAACQVGITISSLMLGAYGQSKLAPVLAPLFQRLGGLGAVAAHSTAAAVILIALTTLQMVLGELVPKTAALQYPTRTALWTVIPMQWSLRLFSWFITVLNGSAILVLRLAGLGQAGHRHIHSPDEIELLIAESRQGGLLDAEESHRLRRALRLRQRRVRELMTPRTAIQALQVDTPPDRFVEQVRKSPYTRLPVYGESLDDVLGMVHARDVLLTELVDRPTTAAALSDLLQPVLFVPDSTPADRLLTRMQAKRRQIAIVVDEFGGTAGLITISDVVQDVMETPADEFKVASPGVERLDDGRLRIPGELRVDLAAAQVGAEWQTEALTLAGLVMEVLGHVPTAGERVDLDGVEAEVERVDGPVVVSVVLTPPDRSDGPTSGEEEGDE